MRVRRPIFKVLYEGKNITTDVSRYLIDLKYTDKSEKASDEIQITMQDAEGKWRDAWFPTKGDKLTVEIGYEELAVNCGTFAIDEIEMSGPPDTVSIRGLAASLSNKLRTKTSKAHENKTLRQIAEATAANNGLTLVDGTQQTERVNLNFDQERADLTSAAGTIRTAISKNDQEHYTSIAIPLYKKLETTAESLRVKGKTKEAKYIFDNIHVAARIVLGKGPANYAAARTFVLSFVKQIEQYAVDLVNKSYTRTTSALDNVRIDRITQNRETDLAFLMRVGELFGFVFSVRDTSLILVQHSDIEKRDPVGNVDRTDLKSYSIKDKNTKTYKKATVKYHDPKTNQVVSHSVDAGTDSNSVDYDQRVSEDDLEIREKAENQQQAEMMVKAALHKKNSQQCEGNITVEGNPLFVAGNNFDLTGMGALSGKYTITESTHTIDRGGGYTTDLSIKKVKKPDASGSGSGSGISNKGFCQEKSNLSKLAALVRQAVAKKDVEWIKQQLKPAHDLALDIYEGLNTKGAQADAKTFGSSVTYMRRYLRDGRPIKYTEAKTFLLTFASYCDRLAGKLEC